MTAIVYPVINIEDLQNLSSKIDNLAEALARQNKQESEWIPSTQVPSYLGVSKRTWQNYRDRKLIPFSQISRKIWVKRSDLDAFIESGMVRSRCRYSK